MSKKPLVKKPMFGGARFGARQLVQPGVEYMGKEKDTRRHRRHS